MPAVLCSTDSSGPRANQRKEQMQVNKEQLEVPQSLAQAAFGPSAMLY